MGSDHRSTTAEPVAVGEAERAPADADLLAGHRWPLGIGLSIGLFAIVWYLVFFPLPCDDHWWHIATGRIVLDTASVPDHDVFSFTYEGAPWVNWEWLAGVFLALAWDLGGPFGMVFLRFLALASALALVLRHRALAGRLGHGNWVLLGSLLAILVLQARTADRPHTLAFALLALADLLTTRLISGFQRKTGAGLVLFFVVWANLHPSWILGMILVAVRMADELLVAWREQRLRAACKPLLPTLGALLLTPLATPHGARFFSAVKEIFAEKVSPEWGSFLDYVGPFHFSLLAFVALGLLYLPSALRRPRLETLFVLAVGVMALRHVRFTPLFALLVLARIDFPGRPRWSPRISSRLTRLLSVLILVMGWVAVQFVMQGLGNGLGLGVDSHRNPVSPADFMEERGLAGRVYCTSKQAHGYMSFRLWPEVLVYIDGRVPQVYAPEFLEKYVATGEPEMLRSEIDRWQIDHIVLVKGLGSPLNRLVAEHLRASEDFGLLYFDPDHAIWTRRTTRDSQCSDCRFFEALDPWVLSGVAPEKAISRFGRETLAAELAYLQQIAPESTLTQDLQRDFGPGVGEAQERHSLPPGGPD